MNYIDRVAIAIAHEANDDPFEDDGYAGIELYRFYAVLLLAKGTAVTAEDVHSAWSAWACGYRSGSDNIRPFNELSTEYQAQDEPYVIAIHRAARALGITS